MNKSFKSIDLSFESNERSSCFYESFRRPAQTQNSSKKQSEIISWLQSQGISFPLELIPEKFSSGSYLCMLINNLTNSSLKYNPRPITTNDKKLNIRKALGFLRKLKNFKSNCTWNEDDIFNSRSSIIWSLLSDLFSYSSRQKARPISCSGMRTATSFKQTAKLIKLETHEINLTETITKIRTWLDSLNLLHLLVPEHNFIRDNLRNGVLICSILQVLGHDAEFCEFPENTEEVYNNIEVALNTYEEIIPIKKMDLFLYTEPREVWNLLAVIMKFFPKVEKNRQIDSSPYNSQQTRLLQDSVLAWATRLLSCPALHRFEDLARALSKGDLLAKLVTKVTKKEVKGVICGPKTDKVALANIEKSLNTLKTDPKVSQEHTKSPERILHCDEKFILLLLEDLHRAYSGLSQQQGKSQGPFIVPSTRASLTPDRSFSQYSYTQNLTPSKPTSTACKLSQVSQASQALNSTGKTSFTLISNSKTAMDFYLPAEGKSSPGQENLAEFAWLKKISVPIPAALDLTLDKLDKLADGVFICQVLSILEYKSIEKVQNCPAYTPAARRNLKLALEILKQKPSLSSKVLYIEDKLYEGHGESFRQVLSEISRIYKSTISNLIRFSRHNRTSSCM